MVLDVGRPQPQGDQVVEQVGVDHDELTRPHPTHVHVAAGVGGR